MRLAAAIAVFFAAAPAPAADFEGFRIPSDQVVQRIHAVAILPARNLSGVEIPPAVRERHEKAIAAGLENVGLRVVPSAACAATLRNLSELMGGVYDSVTGKADPEKQRALRDHLFRELARLHEIDGLIDWGYRERTVAEPSSENQSLFQSQRSERVTGLSTWLTLSDRSDVTLYAADVILGWTELRIEGRRERLPAEPLLAASRDRRLAKLMDSLFDAYTEPAK